MIYNYKNRNILEIPFDEDGFLNEFSTLEALKINSAWLIPQAQEQINKKFTLVRNDQGLICPKLTLNEFVKNHPESVKWFNTLFSYLKTIPRGEIIQGSQNKQPEVSALVPLILASFKKYRGVKYCEWDWFNEYMKVFVDKDLLDAVTLGFNIEVSKEERCNAREYCLQVKSGAKLGTTKKPTQQYSVTSRAFKNDERELNSLPKLRKIMECQLWVAHPSLRTELMLLDVNNLDSMPEPLVEETLSTTKYVKEIEEELPWNA